MKRLDDVFKSAATGLAAKATDAGASADSPEAEAGAEVAQLVLTALRVVAEEFAHAAAQLEGYYVIDAEEAEIVRDAIVDRPNDSAFLP